MAPHEEVSPKVDLRQALTSASGPAQRMPASQGGKTSAVGTSSWTNPVTKPIPRHATSAVLCMRTPSVGHAWHDRCPHSHREAALFYCV